MIEVSVAYQTVLFLKSLVVGAILMVGYDLLRISRIALKTSNLIVTVEDIAYVLAAALLLFSFLISESYGELRLFLILGIFLGVVLCYFTVSQVLLASARKIISVVRAVLRFINRWFLSPVYRLTLKFSRFTIKKVNFLCSFIKKVAKSLKNRLKQWAYVLYNRLRAWTKVKIGQPRRNLERKVEGSGKKARVKKRAKAPKKAVRK